MADSKKDRDDDFFKQMKKLVKGPSKGNAKESRRSRPKPQDPNKKKK